MKNPVVALIVGILIGVGGLYFFLPYDPLTLGRGSAGADASLQAEDGERIAAGDTLRRVRQRGFIQCGVSQGLPGFSNPDERGRWSGIDVDFCRAIAAAIFGNPDQVRFRPLSAKDRFTALQSGEIDILSRNTTWTMSRDTQLGFNFVGVTYYDGQSFMVRKAAGIKTTADLAGATICTETGTTTELNLADYFRSRGLSYRVLSFEKNDEAIVAYDRGRCDAYTTDASGLYATRLKLADPDANTILSEIISKEPLGPAVRQGDPQWEDIARWTLNALLEAEEFGITSANINEMLESDNPRVKRLLGREGAYGGSVGLDANWAANAIRAVGNYGEMFERNVGKNTPLGIERGLNAQWTDGGLQYAPPVR
ncbi:extracellular solute-binding protein family 3 [Parvibaculum lavamentivorans DS-1]|uniref:Extracellular solute-binding protein family 3 n=1 Tax=Parvibaculum lavamentivorans (strain DS-1 / DSM 13023 / NCIMB 13966) TaxID=402881 RepID=A7HXF8_PARL1|nr:amino acid ABC transporter substrate-binding protein [Parvibaculum lavamentivorans]ABS64591.1 extracellular solute-binding protein family 3 [Parvibaculum lavamentivorans DS-1]